jgi:hypothetical protein
VSSAALLALNLGYALPGCTDEILDRESLLGTFKEIHRNIYGVYSLTDPVQIFRHLAASCDGEELEKQVFEYLKCLKVQARFNTQISIVDVIYNDVRLLEQKNQIAEVYCKWIVIGKIRHPTHIHRKTNLNEAIYRVRPDPKRPRIVGYDLITNQALERKDR